MSQLFKGIALFTPGGDFFYCIDPSKQGRWHLHLCVRLQEILNLSEPPHFLIPGYTATIDRWLDSNTGELKTAAEAYPAVKRYQPLLNAAFGTEELVWQTVPWEDSTCNPILLETYREQFPQLWQDHDLVVRIESAEKLDSWKKPPAPSFESILQPENTTGYVLRLFISGNNMGTEQTLKVLHQMLEEGLGNSYTLKIIDILKYPEEAEINQVSATPTLLRVSPAPVRRIVGELSDWTRVLQILTSS